MDKPETTFTQKRHGTRLVFEFSQDTLSITHEDGSGENSRSLAYETINMENPAELLVRGYYLKRPEYFLYMAAGLLIVAGGLGRYGSVLFALAFICLGVRIEFARRRGIKYTIFEARGGKILIMQDKQHDMILAELKKCRVARLRKVFSAVDMTNDPGKELLKFQWLRKTGAITEQEFEQAKGQIRNPLTNAVVPDPLVH